MKAFTEAETESHLTAQFRWVPFVARLLGEGPLRGTSASLELNPEALNQESVTGIKVIINRAVWRFLARECGWSERRIVTAQGNLNTCRLWQQPSAPALRFTDASVELLLTIYNGTRGAARIHQLPLPECHHAPGDLLLLHLVFLRLQRDLQLAGIGTNENWTPWLSNPFNALKACVLDTQVSADAVHWDALLAPELRCYIPWILARINDDWLEEESNRWVADLDLVGNRLQTQTDLLAQLIQRAERIERPDLLAPVMEYLQQWMPKREYVQRRFEAVTRQFSMRERNKLGKRLTNLAALTRDLTRIQSDLLSLHPVEREAPANLFLSTWEDLEFSKICWDSDEFRRQITPTLT